MLRLAIDCGFPSIRLFLQSITAREHQELTDLLSVEPVGSERLDWHFARLYSILVALLGSTKNKDVPDMTEWLLERLIMPKTEVDEEQEEEQLREHLRAAMQGFAARTGAIIEPVDPNEPTVADLERLIHTKDNGR